VLVQSFLLEDLRGDIKNLGESIEDIRERKTKLHGKVKTLTHELVGEAKRMTIELEEQKEDVIKWKKIKDSFSKLATKLENDRTSGSYRY